MSKLTQNQVKALSQDNFIKLMEDNEIYICGVEKMTFNSCIGYKVQYTEGDSNHQLQEFIASGNDWYGIYQWFLDPTIEQLEEQNSYD